MTYLRAGEG